MVAEDFVSIIEKVCTVLQISDISDLVSENEVVTRELRNVLFQYKSLSKEKYIQEFKLPAPLMINFLRVYSSAYSGKNLDPRKVTIVFRNVIGEFYNLL